MLLWRIITCFYKVFWLERILSITIFEILLWYKFLCLVSKFFFQNKDVLAKGNSLLKFFSENRLTNVFPTYTFTPALRNAFSAYFSFLLFPRIYTQNTVCSLYFTGIFKKWARNSKMATQIATRLTCGCRGYR